MTTVANWLAHSLLEIGIDKVFGLPGGENVEILDALGQAGIDFVLVRNESSAIFMADAYGRIKGKPGAALTTLGPGAMNAMAGAGHAWLDRAPVVILTARTAESYSDIHTHQVLELTSLFASIVKQTLVLLPESLSELPISLALLAAGRPGPIHIQVSNEAAAGSATQPEPGPRAALAGPPDGERLAKARQLVSQARHPLIVAGLGLEPSQPYRPLQALAEALQAPLLVTPKAKGALSDRHPLAGGVIGLTRTDPAYELLAEADCVIAVGFDVVELVKIWDFPGTLIWVAPWTNHDPVIPAQAELVGDLAPILTQLVTESATAAADWGAQRVQRLREKLAARTHPAAGPGRVTPQAVLHALRAVAPDDTILTVDVGSHKIFFSLEWPTYTANSFLLSNGLSSMGFGLAGAIGAAMAAPNQPVVCITGDGGMGMVMGELGLLAERGLNVTVIVLNDSALDLIRSAQRRAGKVVRGTEFSHNPDFVQIAQAFGLPGHRIDTVAALQPILDMALTSPGPRLVEVMIDPVGYPTTPAGLVADKKS